MGKNPRARLMQCLTAQLKSSYAPSLECRLRAPASFSYAGKERLPPGEKAIAQGVLSIRFTAPRERSAALCQNLFAGAHGVLQNAASDPNGHAPSPIDPQRALLAFHPSSARRAIPPDIFPGGPKRRVRPRAADRSGGFLSPGPPFVGFARDRVFHGIGRRFGENGAPANPESGAALLPDSLRTYGPGRNSYFGASRCAPPPPPPPHDARVAPAAADMPDNRGVSQPAQILQGSRAVPGLVRGGGSGLRRECTAQRCHGVCGVCNALPAVSRHPRLDSKAGIGQAGQSRRPEVRLRLRRAGGHTGPSVREMRNRRSVGEDAVDQVWNKTR